MKLITKLKQNHEYYGFFKPGDTVITAVSGGIDSMALLHALHSLAEEWEIRLIAAHLDHQFRGQESEADAELVRDFAERLKIPAEVSSFDVSGYMAETGKGVQLAAREIRYRFLKTAAGNYGAHAIATAHHVNDQAETLMLRLLRGTSPGGLAGIPPMRKEAGIAIVRPFLPSVSREDIAAYAAVHQLPFRHDRSNDSRKYMRNRVRLDVMPLLRELNIGVDGHLNRLAELARDESRYLDDMSRQHAEALTLASKPNRVEIDRRKLQSLDIALQRRVIKLILNHLTLSDEMNAFHIEEIVRLAADAAPSASRDLHQRLRVFNSYGRMVLTTEEMVMNEDFIVPVNVPGITRIPPLRKKMRAVITEEPLSTIPEDCCWAVFDAEGLAVDEESLMIRARRPGDRIRVIGLSGTKKVKDILIDDKVPRESRDAYPVLVSGEEVIWVPALRRSDAAVTHDQTKQYIYFFWEEDTAEDTSID